MIEGEVQTSQSEARTVTRRRLIGLGVGGGVSLGAIAGSPVSALGRVRAALLSQPWSRSTYIPRLGQKFTVRGWAAKLQLVSVDDVPFCPAGSDQAFMLRFSGPPRIAAGLGEPLPLSHPGLGEIALFLTPGAVASGRQTFVAIIDRTHG